MSHSESSNINDSGNKCNVCEQPTQTKCSNCKLIYYCSREHQKRDWKSHKAFCKPYMVKEDDILGRHLVATRDIKGGDVIIKEAPLIWGLTDHPMIPICFGCGREFSQFERATPCQKCGLPMCRDECQNASDHLPECFYTVNRGLKLNVQEYCFLNSYRIAILRCLYYKQFLPKIWSKIETLQSHCEERKKTIKYLAGRVGTTDLTEIFKLGVDEETVLKIFGILHTNSFQVSTLLFGIYHLASMLEHNCKPNCTYTFTEKREIIIIAGEQEIKKGAHLSVSYVKGIWGTIQRRQFLHETYFFSCQCQRCSDVTEFGTFFSCIKCTDKSCKGMSTPKSFLEDGLPWECNKCHKITSYEEVNNLLEDLGKKKENVEKASTSAVKAFIKQSEVYLPSTHYYITDVKFAFSKLLFDASAVDGWDKLSDNDLMLQLGICKDLLSLLEAIAPACNQDRGIFLFLMDLTTKELTKRKVTKGEEIPNYQLSLVESKSRLSKIVETLKHESILTKLGLIREGARVLLNKMERDLGLGYIQNEKKKIKKFQKFSP